MLGWDDLFERANFLMRENKAKNTVEVGEFNEFLREHGTVEQFIRILGVTIKEEKNIHILHN